MLALAAMSRWVTRRKSVESTSAVHGVHFSRYSPFLNLLSMSANGWVNSIGMGKRFNPFSITENGGAS
jgi:hypothetical protein